MYIKQELLKDIEKMNVDPSGTIHIHSSMKSIGEVDGGVDTVLDAWMEYMKDGLLTLPTHTWEQIPTEKKIFDVRTEPSCVGVIGETFRKRKEAIRSLHPTHSVTACGNDAAGFVAGEERRLTPCSRDGAYGKLLDRNAKIIFLGCSMSNNTYIHGVEEWNDVPDRISDTPIPLKIFGYKGEEYDYMRYGHHCNQIDDVSQFYSKLEAPLLKHGAIYYGTFGDAKCVIADAKMMYEITSDLLKRNPNLFINGDPVPTEWY